MFDLIIGTIFCVAIISTLFEKFPQQQQLKEVSVPQPSPLALSVTDDNAGTSADVKTIVEETVSDEELVEELRSSLPDMKVFLNVSISGKTYRLEQIKDNLVRIRECIAGPLGIFYAKKAEFQTGTVTSVSNEILRLV